MNELENQNDQKPSADELLKEIRVLKRKLALSETNLERVRMVNIAQDRVESILNESLKKELRFFKLVLENTNNILLLFDFDGRFAYASNAFLADAGIANFGLINGSHYRDVLKPLISEEILGRFSDAVERAVDQKTTVFIEEQMAIGSKDSTRTFTIQITPMTDDKGKSTGILALFNDITEINEALETANRANLAKSEFLANMSHEIRTPLNAIIGMTAIGKSAADTERKDYCFTRIEGASNHLLGVINDILDMSKIEANKLELSPMEFDFEGMLQRVVNVINFRVDEKQQRLTVHIDNDIPKNLIGDDQRLAQVITNLLSNAVKFTPEEGFISLKTHFLGEEMDVCTIQFEVTDTGIGINTEQQSRLFASFQQAESSTARKFGGTGLGLAISKSIVEMMGGRIWVESQLGKGSTFAFTVQAKRGAEKSISSCENISWDNIRILAIDDDPDVLLFFEEIMLRLGAHCDAAKSGEEALSIIENSGAYHVYFIDWKMHGMDGIQLTKEIKTRESDSGSVVIMISAADWNTIEENAKKAGVDKFLSKPLFPSAIKDIMSQVLGAKQQQAKAAHDDTPVSFAGRRILLAEDVEINREIVLALLEPTLLEIDCAENGEEVFRMFSESPDKYDMIFMDVQMPKMDGYEATRAIRVLGSPKARTVPIIAMTANVFREDIEKCFEAGMNSHIGKPLDLNEVISALQKYL